LAWSIRFSEKSFVLIPFLCISIPCCDRFALHVEEWLVGFVIFAIIWNVDGNWNGFSGEELWGWNWCLMDILGLTVNIRGLSCLSSYFHCNIAAA